MSEARDEHAVEREWLAAARTGDDEAFAALYRRHHDSALAYARTLTHHARAQDLVAEAVVRVYRLLQNGAGPESSFRSYLFMTIRSINVDGLRRTGREIPVGDVVDQLDRVDPDSSEAMAECDTILRALRTLPQRWQQVLWATAVEGHTPTELSAKLDLAPNAVAVLAKRAREGLRQAYLSQHIETIPAGKNCGAFAGDMARYIRGSLVPNRHAVVHDHVEECADCALVVHGLDCINTRLGAVLLPAMLLSLPGSVGSAGVVHGTASAGHSVLAPLKAKLLQLPHLGQLIPSLTVPSAVAAAAGSVALTAAVTVGVVHWQHDTSEVRTDASSVQAREPDVRGPRTNLSRPSTPEASPSPSSDPTDGGSRPSSGPVGSPPTPGVTSPPSPPTPDASTPAPGATTTPAPTPAMPTPTVEAAPAGTQARWYTDVGTCSMNGADLVCTASNGTQLILVPSDGGSCSAGDQVADCVGPLTLSSLVPPETEPTVDYTQTGSTDSCHVRQQELHCYRV